MKRDLSGQRFGRLVVVCENGRDNNRNVRWLCKCDCGNEVIVSAKSLVSGRTKSCGCYLRETRHLNNFRHGYSRTPLYHVWEGVMRRTGHWGSEQSVARRNYADRGIDVCDEWLDFLNFKSWAIASGYKKGLQIDRSDNSLGYFPSNCHWVTLIENLNNRRCTSRLSDGTSLATFCHTIGVQTCENGRATKPYQRYRYWLRAYGGALHPELVVKANDFIHTMRQCIQLLTLLKEARELRSGLIVT